MRNITDSNKNSIFSFCRRFLVLILFPLLMTFSGCNFFNADPKSSGDSECTLVSVRFSVPEYETKVSQSGRSVYAPSALSNTDITQIELNGSFNGDLSEIPDKYKNYATIKESFSSYDEFKSCNIQVIPGIWKLELSVYVNSEIVATSLKEEKILENSSSITFTLVENAEGKGNFDITVEVKDSKIKGIVGEIYSSTDFTDFIGAKQQAVTTTTPFNELQHGFKAGFYLYKIKFFDHETNVDNCYCTKSIYIRVKPGQTTKIELSYDAEELNTPFSIIYETNGGEFKNSDYIREFNKYQSVTLPTGDDISYSGYTFKGWYKTENFEDDPIAGWDFEAESADVKLYAKWMLNFNPGDGVFVDSTVSETGDGSLEKPFKTLKEAINSFTDKKATEDDGSIKNTIYLLSDYLTTNALLDGVTGSDKELYVKIQGLKGGNAEKVTFTCDIEQKGTDNNTVSALWLSGDFRQRFHFKNIDFTSTTKTSSYGLMGVGKTSELTLEDCSFKNIKTSRNVSALYSEGQLILKNVEITGNVAEAEATDVEKWTSAVVAKDGSLEIDGAVKIYENTCSTEGGKNGNLYLGRWDEEQNKHILVPIKISGKISGSKIHFTPVEYSVSVTDGYSTSFNMDAPANYLICEDGWEVTLKDGEAYVSDGIEVAYVSSSGSDTTGTGSQTKPFATINHAVEKITGQSNFDSQKLYEIKLMSDLVANLQTDFVRPEGQDEYSFAYIAADNLKLSIEPATANSNVVISGKSGLNGRIVYVEGSNVELTLINLSIVGGYSTLADGAGIYSKAQKLTLKNCCLYDNYTTGDGGALYLGSGTASINNCIFEKTFDGTENSNEASKGGAIYVENSCQSLILSGKNYIWGNKSGSTDGNIYLPGGKTISIDGDISGSKIGITVSQAPQQNSPVPFVRNDSGSVAAYADCFVSDNEDYYVTVDENGDEKVLKLAFIPFDVLTSSGDFKKFSALTATDEAVGIRFYQKNTFPAGETQQKLSSFILASSDANIQKIDSIVIGLNHSDGLKWQTSANEGVGGCIRFADLEGAANSAGTGLDSWKIICEVANSSFTADPEANFPAFAYILNYRNTEAKYENGWYMPSANELTLIYENKNLINLCLQKVGGSQLSDSIYWTSTTRNDDSQTFDSLALDFNNGLWTSEMNRYLNSHNVIPILALDSDGNVIGSPDTPSNSLNPVVGENNVKADELLEFIGLIATSGADGDYILKVDDSDFTVDSLSSQDDATAYLMNSAGGYQLKTALKALDGTSKFITLDFSGCTKLKTIPANAFGLNGTTNVAENVVGCILPDTINKIGNCAFAYTNLKSIELPASIFDDSNNGFGGSEFVNCLALETVVIKSPVAPNFAGCTALKNLTLEEGVVTIRKSAFDGCTSLESVTIPSTVKTIKQYAFRYTSLATADFEDKEGWVSNSNSLTLTSSSTNANWLKTTYVDYDWTKK
ncbi:MAG: leucine-rich repeat protein [Treponema sp.]|nr:leucine-rich repeat protein [Candidatus Treponema equifaecale]